jgi:hypothetical protein
LNRDKSKLQDSILDAELLSQWIDAWNSWHLENLVASSVQTPPCQSLALAWKRAQCVEEIRELLQEPKRVYEELKHSSFLRGAGWFRLEKLFGGRNANKAFILKIVVDGGYRDRTVNPSRVVRGGPGVNFEPKGVGDYGSF